MKAEFNLIKFQERIIKGALENNDRGQFKRCIKKLERQGFSDDQAVQIYYDALDVAELERIARRDSHA